jgi:hypothetical protein
MGSKIMMEGEDLDRLGWEEIRERVLLLLLLNWVIREEVSRNSPLLLHPDSLLLKCRKVWLMYRKEALVRALGCQNKVLVPVKRKHSETFIPLQHFLHSKHL